MQAKAADGATIANHQNAICGTSDSISVGISEWLLRAHGALTGESMMSNHRYVVTIDQPKDVTNDQMAEYIKLAIASWGAGLPPPPADSPFFDLDVESVTSINKHKHDS
jgi:hypothetical protein